MEELVNREVSSVDTGIISLFWGGCNRGLSSGPGACDAGARTIELNSWPYSQLLKAHVAETWTRGQSQALKTQELFFLLCQGGTGHSESHCFLQSQSQAFAEEGTNV